MEMSNERGRSHITGAIMRVNGEISYQLDHGEGLAGVSSVWSVPYSAVLRRGVVEEVEADGMPTLTGLALRVGNLQRPLDFPSTDEQFQWQLVWIKESKYCAAELAELFAADCLEKYWGRIEGVAA